MSATPAPYNRQSNFVTEAQGNANITVSQIAVELDAEFNAINTAVDETQSRLAEIQRDDGQLKNGIVTSSALSTDILNKITTGDNSYRGVWAVGTTYYVGDVVYKDLSLYYCAIQHTAANFTTELNDGDWTLVGATSSDTNDPNAYVPLTRWSLNPNGTATVFTITGTTVTNSAAYLVTVDGVLQDPASYTITTNTITFSEAPPSGTAVVVVGIGYAKGVLAGAISTVNLADSAVTTAKIADSSITTAKIADGAITSAKIADGAIATADLADGAVTSAKIADGTIATSDLANGAVTPAKLSTGGPNWDTSGNASVSGAVNVGPSGTVFSTASGMQIGSTNAQPLYFQTNNTVKASITSDGTFNIGGNPITNCPTTAKAWVNFSGTTAGTFSPRSSSNVSSITRTAVGSYTVNYTTAMSDIDYCAIATKVDGNGVNSINIVTLATGSVSIASKFYNGTTSASNDAPTICVAIFGN